jgi:hypothetical protein
LADSCASFAWSLNKAVATIDKLWTADEDAA